MPNCFSLTEKDTNRQAILQDVDDRMRDHFGAEPDAINWYRAWYQIIGFGLACGNSYDKLRELVPDMADVIDWLEKHYAANAWCERSRN